MREYLVFEAESDGGTSFLGRVPRSIANWRKHRRLRLLFDIDDYLLSDIGLTRADVEKAARLAWYMDPVAELERVRLNRARRGVRFR